MMLNAATAHAVNETTRTTKSFRINPVASRMMTHAVARLVAVESR